MHLLEAIVLGLVQGVTEFLPISSSAHLILVPHLFGWPDAGLRFAVVTNAGTLTAAMVYFRRDLLALLRPGAAPGGRTRLLRAVALATIPVALAAAAFGGWLAAGARRPLLIALTTIGFGVLLAWADRVGSRQRSLDSLRWRDTALIGLAQALALVPGTSRSGITITAGLLLGFDRRAAARFSFLLAIPVGLLALGRDVIDLLGLTRAAGAISHGGGASGAHLAIGFAVAGLSAYAVIDGLLRWLERQTMTPFVIYRIVLGVMILATVWPP